MTEPHATHLAFAGFTRFATGTLAEVARAVRTRLDAGETASIHIFAAETGAPVDVDLHGTPDEVADRARAREEAAAAGARSGPGRPRLGVPAREVTLLPRHWDWLAAQPGGASVTLRKLVDAARKQGHASEQVRLAQDATHRFLYALAGDLPGFEEAARALYAWDLERFADRIAGWPPDVREHALASVQRARAAASR